MARKKPQLSYEYIENGVKVDSYEEIPNGYKPKFFTSSGWRYFWTIIAAIFLYPFVGIYFIYKGIKYFSKNTITFVGKEEQGVYARDRRYNGGQRLEGYKRVTRTVEAPASTAGLKKNKTKAYVYFGLVGVFWLLPLGLGLIGGSISNQETKNNEVAIEKATVIVVSKNEEDKLAELKVFASRLRGGGSIKDVKLEDGVATLTYVKDFEEYKELLPQSTVTEKMRNAYWSDKTIEKLMVAGPARLMKDMDYLKKVKIILPLNSRTYISEMTREDVEEFSETTLSYLGADDANWMESFADMFIYNEGNRKKIYDKYTSVN